MRPEGTQPSRVFALVTAGLPALFALWAASQNVARVWRFTIDDAGISYAYAKHLAQGSGPVAAQGAPFVEGYSNALWVFLLVPFQWLGLSIPAAAKWLGLGLTLLATFFAADWVGRALRIKDARYARLSFALLLSAAAASLEVSVWAVAGLENALLAATLMAVVALDARETQARSPQAWSAVAAFLVCITRPEGLLYVAPLLGLKAVDSWRGVLTRKQVSRWFAWFFGLMLAYHAVHYAVFRQWVPNTYFAKPANKDWAKGFSYLADTFKASLVQYALPFAGAAVLAGLRRTLLPLWYCVACTAFILYSGGDWMPYARFLSFGILPLLALALLGSAQLVALGSAALSRLLVARPNVSRFARELSPYVYAALAAVAIFRWWGMQAPRFAEVERKAWCHFCERREDALSVRRVGQAARLTGATFLTHDFGGPAWTSNSDLYPIDFLGLCDRSIALIRRRIDRTPEGRYTGDRTALYQHLFHEQPYPPSWLHLPDNFWRDLQNSPEFLFDYFQIPTETLPYARRDASVGLARAELVDFFPNGENVPFVPLTRKFALVAKELLAFGPDRKESARLQPGSQVQLNLAVVAREALSGAETFQVRVRSTSASAESTAVRIARGLPEVAPQISNGEPIALHFEFELPASDGGVYDVELGVADGGAAEYFGLYHFATLSELTPKAASARVVPRYPAALPAARHDELRALRAAVSDVVERRHRLGFGVVHEPELAERLVELAKGYATSGDDEQAYLAYLWSTHADNRRWRDVADAVFKLRPRKRDDEHAMEVGLLRRYYASGSRAALEHLIHFYTALERRDEKAYFEMRRQALGVAGEPLSPGPELAFAEADFESEVLKGFGEPGVFESGIEELRALRGQHGRALLASSREGKGGRGELRSPEFEITGPLLSLLVGGDPHDTGVELWVSGKAVRDAHGSGAMQLIPRFWDVPEFVGQRAQLRLYDRSRESFMLLDRVMLWH